MNFRIKKKNHASDSKIGSLHKIDFRADGTHESHPTAWELNINSYVQVHVLRIQMLCIQILSDLQETAIL